MRHQGAMAHELARIAELAGVFLKLGASSFGGPAAHVAMMEEEVVRRRLGSAAVGRLHRLWDVTVDARLSAAGRLVAGPALGRHRSAIAADLPGVARPAIERVVACLWARPRPTFPTLRSWVERPIDLLRVAAPGEMGRPRPDRCPLCGFPSQDIVRPDPAVGALVSADYPDWRPEDGLCGRCTDLFRFGGRLGARR